MLYSIQSQFVLLCDVPFDCVLFHAVKINSRLFRSVLRRMVAVCVVPFCYILFRPRSLYSVFCLAMLHSLSLRNMIDDSGKTAQQLPVNDQSSKLSLQHEACCTCCGDVPDFHCIMQFDW